MTCIGVQKDSEKCQQGAGILLQVGSTVEWGGALAEEAFTDLGWWDMADLFGTGFGLAASILVLIPEPTARTAATICTLADGAGAATALIGGKSL
jgi:hypothetical protein